MPDRAPHQIIADAVAAFSGRPDVDVLAALSALPALVDESDASWNSDAYWHDVAYPYIALADVAAQRRLRPAIRLLLDRACFGDPGEIMRGLRHSLEAIVNPDWHALADECIAAARSPRSGTVLWAMHQLAVLEDAGARPVFEHALSSPEPQIRDFARVGLDRLDTA
jgi:hypothetical protein